MVGNWDETAQVAPEPLDAEPIELGDLRSDEMPLPFAADALDTGGNWALRTSAGRVDLLQWVQGVEGYESLNARAIDVDLPRVGHIRFAGYADLVAMKRAAGRPEDLRDLAELRSIRGER